MSKSSFAKTIISKIKTAIGTDGNNYSSNSASLAMKAVANGITEYLIANTTITVTYAGIIPGVPPVNDPVITDSFQIVGACAPTGPSNSFDAWIKQIEANIIAGFALAPSGKAGVVFVQKPFLSVGIMTMQSILKANHNISDDNPQQKIWEIICGGIMDWINGIAINTTPGIASRPSASSTGTACITKISVL